jgi:hypothetical protein
MSNRSAVSFIAIGRVSRSDPRLRAKRTRLARFFRDRRLRAASDRPALVPAWDGFLCVTLEDKVNKNASFLARLLPAVEISATAMHKYRTAARRQVRLEHRCPATHHMTVSTHQAAHSGHKADAGHFKVAKAARRGMLRAMATKPDEPQSEPPRRRIITAIASGCANVFAAPARMR